MNTIDWNQYKQAYVLSSNEIDNPDYLFREQLDKVKKLVKSLRKDDRGMNKANKVIAISGERGSGKSSLLGTIKTAIKYDSELKNCWVIGVTDPNEFSDSMGILELILTRMYNEIDIKKNNEKVHCQNELTRDLLKWLDVIAKEKNSPREFYNKLSDIEILDQFNKRLTIVDEIGELLKRGWEYIVNEGEYRVGNIVVLIDDLDLVENNRIYKMLEEIKQVLSVNVITIISYRPKQLLNSVHNKKIEENKELLDRSFIEGYEIRQQAATYVEKLVPKTHIISMPRNEEVLRKKLVEVFGNEKEIINDEFRFVKEKTIIDNIYEAIERLTNINIKGPFVSERGLFESSFSLRTVMQIFEFLTTELKNHNDDKRILLGNIRKLRDYFYQSSEELFKEDNFDSITRWLQAEPEFKNFYIYQDIYKAISKENQTLNINYEDSLIDLLNIDRVQPYNVCLGDVVEIIEAYKMRTTYTPQKYHYIYMLKIMYSIELLESLLTEVFQIKNGQLVKNLKYVEINNNFYFADEVNNSNNKFWETTYYKLTRYNIIPESTDFLRLNTRESVIFNDGNNISFQMLDKILYTPLAKTSEIKANARLKIKEDQKKAEKTKNYRDPLNYRFRHVFEYRNPGESKIPYDDINRLDEHYNIERNRLYTFNPYVYLVKEQYLHRALKENLYVFYSFFDIDIILSKAHDRASNTDSKLNLMFLFTMTNKIWNRLFMERTTIFNGQGNESILYEEEEINEIAILFELAHLSRDERNKKINELKNKENYEYTDTEISLDELISQSDEDKDDES